MLTKSLKNYVIVCSIFFVFINLNCSNRNLYTKNKRRSLVSKIKKLLFPALLMTTSCQSTTYLQEIGDGNNLIKGNNLYIKNNSHRLIGSTLTTEDDISKGLFEQYYFNGENICSAISLGLSTVENIIPLELKNGNLFYLGHIKTPTSTKLGFWVFDNTCNLLCSHYSNNDSENDYINSIILDEDHVVGGGYSDRNSKKQGLIIKYNPSCNSTTEFMMSALISTEDEKEYIINDLAIKNNDIYYTGTHKDNEQSSDFISGKFIFEGNKIKFKYHNTLGGHHLEGGHSITINSKNETLILGMTNGNGFEELVIVQLLNDGTKENAKAIYGSHQNFKPKKIITDHNDNILILAYILKDLPKTYIVKINKEISSLIWEKEFFYDNITLNISDIKYRENYLYIVGGIRKYGLNGKLSTEGHLSDYDIEKDLYISDIMSISPYIEVKYLNYSISYIDSNLKQGLNTRIITNTFTDLYGQTSNDSIYTTTISPILNITNISCPLAYCKSKYKGFLDSKVMHELETPEGIFIGYGGAFVLGILITEFIHCCCKKNLHKKLCSCNICKKCFVRFFKKVMSCRCKKYAKRYSKVSVENEIEAQELNGKARMEDFDGDNTTKTSNKEIDLNNSHDNSDHIVVHNIDDHEDSTDPLTKEEIKKLNEQLNKDDDLEKDINQTLDDDLDKSEKPEISYQDRVKEDFDIDVNNSDMVEVDINPSNKKKSLNNLKKEEKKPTQNIKKNKEKNL